MRHPEIIQSLNYDGFVDDEWVCHANIYYICSKVDGEIAGLILGVPKNPVLVESHIAIIPKYRKHTDSIIQNSIQWMQEKTNYRKVVGQVPEYNKSAVNCFTRNGWNREGVNKGSVMKDGVLHDQIYFGLEV